MNFKENNTEQLIIDLYKNGNSFLKIKSKINVPLGKIKLTLWNSGLYEPANLDSKVTCRGCKQSFAKTAFTKLQIVNAGYICKSCAIFFNDIHQLKKFGLTKENYNKLLKEQNNKCAVCKTSIGHVSKNKTNCRLAVDHDHRTGKIRGLLCGSCNRALGLFKDSIDNLQNAISYLKKNVNT